jgi:hypothetical protein
MSPWSPKTVGVAVGMAVAIVAGRPARADLLQVRQIAKGMECAECARNLKVEIQKLDGVEAASASWNRRVLTVSLARGSKTTLTDIRAALRRQHFVPGEAEVVVAGRLVRTAEGEPLLDGGPGVRYRLDLGLVGGAAAGGAGGEVLVTGRVPGEPLDGKAAQADRGPSGLLFVLSLKAGHEVVDSASEIRRRHQ